MTYTPSPERYSNPAFYRASGRSGLRLPAISLGLWHNFGGVDSFENARALVLRAFDLGITHFDLANNYGPPPGSAEENFGRILKEDLRQYRDELIISTKAGYTMWPGPYGDGGSRKYLLSSLDQSLRRMQLDYVDIFYSHRFDPKSPLTETMGALADTVRAGKALYVGLSNYGPEETREGARILRQLGVPCLIHQPRYHLFDRWIENGLTDVLALEGIGCIPYCPLAQGLLTDRYLAGIPADSRAAKSGVFLKADQITEEVVAKVQRLNSIAQARGQKLAQMALAWVLRDPVVTTALIGASKVQQIEDNLAAIQNCRFSSEELASIDSILSGT
jgi:L-glyceraldehyde 3-phosphate reductase